MAPAAATSNSNWLSFSLSPMEMLASSHQTHNPQIPINSPSPHHYFLDPFYTTDWGNQKGAGMGMYTDYVVDQQIDDNNNNNHHHNTASYNNTVPKLEDFFGGDHNNNTASYNSQNESTTQDSSSQLTHLYEPHHHHHHQQQQNSVADYFNNQQQQQHQQDLKTMGSSGGYQGAFSGTSGSEVDDSAATHLGAEFLGHSIESTHTDLVPSFGGGAATTTTNNNSNSNNGGNLSLSVVPQTTDKSIVTVAADSDNSIKKISDTFGQRTSIYRGVTRHRWTGRYEAHLWDNSCRREGQARKGRQVYLGGYDKEEKAARSYDLAALKYWGPTATTNFPISNYSTELEDMKHVTKQEFIASLRRKSSGFSRGASIYRGVTRHHQQGRWQARIGRVAGNKDLYLGTFATEEEAAEAYDIAAIKFRGVNAVTNFEMNRYDVEAILKSNLPIGGAAKRLKLATEAADQKPTLSLDQQSHSSNGSSGGTSSTINFAAIQSVPPISCAVPYDAATAIFHQNLFHHLNSNGGSHQAVASPEAYGSGVGMSSVAPMMSLMPQTPAEFYIWPHQSY
ncbi:AP2-like ethylene-responsive transcription factor AIL6 [Chenopodium quinoa]|uniref:AP2-like ethylene-responsive transcription factor AIL6 n=1 Tax=Chenopodium quinoa TaxID=63459 RepID=UPI000B7863FC|nr:AP2-like ethylene-responsive transcription factor AIL6 [Chenopodium quinoa]